MQQGAIVEIDLNFERYTEQFAVAEQTLMMAGDTRRSGVEIEPIGEAGGLVGLAEQFDAVTAAAIGPTRPTCHHPR